VRFRSLGPFPQKEYHLWFTAEYEKKLGHRGFQMLPRVACPDEYNLDRLLVTVPLHRKPSKKMLAELAERLGAWFQSVSVEGMFGEGPVDSISAGMEIWSTRVAQFTIDVHRSGQNTLNWLTLSLLTFGYEVTPITGVYYDSVNNPGYVGNFLELYEGFKFENPFRVPIPISSKKAPVTTWSQPNAHVEEPAMPSLPPGSVPHPTVRSDSFSIYLTPRYHWDDLEVHVYFGAPVPPDHQQLFADLINSWMDLGSFGAWGGTGIDSGGKPEFDESGESAVFEADMGDATDQTIALTVLIRVLGGFAQDVPIDAVVLGKLGKLK
jgi:hypothetical protein